MQEIWKDIKGYEGLYRISNFGRVFSVRTQKFLKQVFNKKSKYKLTKYSMVYLVVNSKQKRFFVHRLVAEAFVPNPDNKPFVNHLDENPLNNYSDNLQWCTSKENNNYGTRNERAGESLKYNCAKPVAVHIAGAEHWINFKSITDAVKAGYSYKTAIFKSLKTQSYIKTKFGDALFKYI